MGEHKTVLVMLLVLVLIVVALTEIKVSNAQSRTLVVPDDFLTIKSAIDNAADGDTIYIKKGTYESPINQTLVIDKSISLVGEDQENTILKLYPAYSDYWILTSLFRSYSNAITITANACKILNLKIIAKPGGYISATGNQTQIIGNNLTIGTTTRVNVNGFYCNITNNVVSAHVLLNGSFGEIAKNSLYAIYAAGSSNIIKDNICKGLHLDYSYNTTIKGNSVTSDTRGYSGIELSRSHNNLVCNNYVEGFSSNLRLYLSSNNTITVNTIADALTSVSLLASYNNTFYLNNFIDNMEYCEYIFDRYTDRNVRNALPNETLSTSFWDNGIEGNYWEGYEGVDNDGDGIGDTPYIIDGNNQDNYPLMEPIQIPEFPSFLLFLFFLVASLTLFTFKKVWR